MLVWKTRAGSSAPMMRHERERASARLDEDLIKCSVECHGSSAGCVAFGQATQSWRTCLGRTGVIDRLFAPRPCGRGQRRTASAYEAFGRRRPGRHPCLLLPLWPRRVGYPTIAFAIIAFKVSRSKARRGSIGSRLSAGCTPSWRALASKSSLWTGWRPRSCGSPFAGNEDGT